MMESLAPWVAFPHKNNTKLTNKTPAQTKKEKILSFEMQPTFQAIEKIIKPTHKNKICCMLGLFLLLFFRYDFLEMLKMKELLEVKLRATNRRLSASMRTFQSFG